MYKIGCSFYIAAANYRRNANKPQNHNRLLNFVAKLEHLLRALKVPGSIIGPEVVCPN
jgi:hypothetical protein